MGLNTLVALVSSASALRLGDGVVRKPAPLSSHNFDPLGLGTAPKHLSAEPRMPAAPLLLLAAASAAQPDAALAKGGEFGIFEGRIVSLAHPAMMAVCYAASAFAAYTGFQWRRLREIGIGYQLAVRHRMACTATVCHGSCPCVTACHGVRRL